MDSVSKNVALYSSRYENYLVLGDFNAEVDMNAFLKLLWYIWSCNSHKGTDLLQKSGKSILYWPYIDKQDP